MAIGNILTPQSVLEELGSVLSLKAAGGRQVRAMEEEIDLREYVKVIAKRWKWIVGLTVVAVVVAAGASLLVPPTYEATAAISISQPNPSISYTSLIGSTEVEVQVIEMLRASLSPAEQVPGGLIDSVKVSQAQQEEGGLSIHITVQSDTSQKAAAVANAWASLGVKQIVEAEDVEEQLQEQQLQIVKQNLDAAIQALIDFEEENGFGVMGFGALEEELLADREILKVYQAVKEDTDALLREAKELRESVQVEEAAGFTESMAIAIESLLQRAEQSLRTVGGALVVSGEGGRFEAAGFASFQEELQTDRKTLGSYKATRDGIEDLLREARALRDSVQQGGSISSPAIMSILMRQYLQAGSIDSGTTLSFELPEVFTSSVLALSQQREILGAVIVALEARQEAVLARISDQQERFAKQQTEISDAVIVVLKAKQETVSTAVEQLSAEVLQGERTLINKQSELNDLVRTRDIAQQIYDPLATQAEQEKLTTKVGVEVSEVEVISSAKEPGAPIQPNRVQIVLIAGTLGLLVGVFGAFMTDYFKT